MRKMLLIAILASVTTTAFAGNRDLGYHLTKAVVKSGAKVVGKVSKVVYKVGRFAI